LVTFAVSRSDKGDGSQSLKMAFMVSRMNGGMWAGSSNTPHTAAREGEWVQIGGADRVFEAGRAEAAMDRIH
jgi:hypothetical protein